MRVQDVMTRNVETVSAGDPAGEAWDLMRGKRIHHLVVMQGRQIVGVLSDRDVGGSRGASVRRNRTVAELMSGSVVTVPPTTTVRKAASVMRGRSIGCLVVASDTGRIAGIVTVSDLLDLFARGADRGIVEAKRWTLKHRAPHRKRHQAAGSW